jgi:hypothetical protein
VAVTPAPVETPTFGDPIVSLFVVGTAITQGSFDPKGRGFVQAKRNELIEWRGHVERSVRLSRPRDETIDGTFVVSLLFVADRRASHSGRRWWARGTEGDVDKLTRAVLDGLGVQHRTEKVGNQKVKYTTGAGVYSDDRRVIHVTAGKVYAQPGEDPGLQVRVWVLDPALEGEGWIPVPDWPGWRFVHRDHLLCE